MQYFRIIFLFILFGYLSWATAQDKAQFREKKNEFWEKIKTASDEFSAITDTPKIEFKMDFTGKELPGKVSEFKYYWHTPPHSQGRTGSCWCFCTTSFFESEIKRLSGREIKLSEMYTVYWEYVEKARRYVRERGNSYFAEGSEANAVIRIWKKYGIVPAEAYSGMRPGQKYHDHKQMFQEMKNYLGEIKRLNFWNETDVLGNIKSILNYHMDEPPLKLIINETEMTPLEYLDNVVKLKLEDYVDVLSLKQKPYYKQVIYPVPDNWWYNADYYNIPLDVFAAVIKRTIRAGYTINIGGDTSEPGYDADREVAMVPTFDIPAEYIDENARQLRFSNKSTTDDHGIHLIGYQQIDGTDWYLIKDSGSGAFNGPNKGYRFYHEDYIKLKMMDIMVHKDAVADILTRFTADSLSSPIE